MHSGTIGGVIGSVVGIIGGLIGTYFSIKNTKGPKEKAFVVKAGIILWIFVIVVLGISFCLPVPYNFLPLVLFFIFLPFVIRYWNKTQQAIREREGK